MRWFVRLAFCLVTVGCTEPDPVDTGSPDRIVHDPESTADTVDTGSPPVTHPYAMDGFSFVDEHLAGMPQPGRYAPLADDLAFLVDQEISLLVSLTDQPTDPVAVASVGLDLLHLPIPDFTPPTLAQQVTFVDAIRLYVGYGRKVGVHDTAGLGRCGTMLATWFVAEGMEPDEAIAAIRALRPGSIETEAQEQAVFDYAAAY